MNPDWLLKHFDQIGEVPEAVPRLRRFILDLAVRGRLVEQDPNDEPASELLKRIGVEKAQYVRIGQIRNRKVDVFPSEVNNPFIIPSRWLWARFGQLVEFSAGKTPSRHDSSYWNTDDYPWVSISDMTEGGLVVATTKETVSQKAKIVVFKGDPTPAGTLLMSFKLTIGRVSRLAVPAFHNEAIISIYPYIQEIDPYLFRFLPLFSMSGSTKNAIKGATLNRESLGSLPIPLPPLAEQQRIVAKVDSLMAMCDELEAAQIKREKRRDRLVAATLHGLNNDYESGEPGIHATFEESARFYFNHLPRLTTRPEHIQQLRQTILSLAVRGKLVPQDPNNKSTYTLISLIADERRRRAIAGETINTQISADSENGGFPLPQSWRWVKLGFAMNILMGQSPPGETYNTKGEGIPLINGPVEFSEGPFGITIVNQYTTKLTKLCKKGDLLLCVRGSTTGRTNVAGVDACIGRGVAALQSLYADRFIRLFVWSWRDKIIEMGRGIAFPSISRHQIEDLPIPLPPLTEQCQIVAKVDELMALLDELEARLTTTTATQRQFLETTLYESLGTS